MTIREEWEKYRRQVIPADAPSGSVNNNRFAFYAGAAVMFELLTAAADLATDAEIEARIAALDKELRAFAADQARLQETRES